MDSVIFSFYFLFVIDFFIEIDLFRVSVHALSQDHCVTAGVNANGFFFCLQYQAKLQSLGSR